MQYLFALMSCKKQIWAIKGTSFHLRYQHSSSVCEFTCRHAGQPEILPFLFSICAEEIWH